MRRATIVLFTLLLVGACTPMQWVKRDAAAEDFQSALNDCRQEAWRESRTRLAFQYPVAPAVFQDSAGRHFLVYPHGPFADPYGNRFMEEDRLAHFCMRAKGWSLEAAPKQ